MTGRRLEGHAALITGGASGIGEATARLFVRHGARLVIADRQKAKGEALARELGAVFVQVDVTREDEIAAAVDLAVKEFGQLDCLINNAGVIGVIGPIARIPADRWNDTLAVLLNSAFFGMKHAARVMAPRGSGVILTTTSITGLTGGLGQHAYTTAKHAVIGLTRSVAAELAFSGVRVNAVAPGAVPTALTAHRAGNMEVARQNSAQASPLKRAIDADDIAAGFLFLASDDGRNVTGQTLAIDAGVTAFPRAREGMFSAEPNFVDALSGN